MREPSGAGLRKSLYSQRMLPACRHLWRRQHPAPASVPRRGKAHSTPSPLGDGAAGRAWITVRASTFRALATAHLRCSSRASRSPRERRSLSPQRGPARPPPATTAVPRPRLPAHGTPAVPGRTSPQQTAMGGAAAAMAAFSGPPRSYTTASRRPARRRASLRGQAAPAPGARMSADIGAGAAADPQPESRRAVRFAGKSGLGMAAGT